MAESLLFHPHTRHIMLNFCPLLHRFCLEFHCNTVHPWPSWRKKHLYMRLLRSGQMIIWRFQGVKYLHHGKDCLYFVFADYHSASYQYPESILYRHVFVHHICIYICYIHVSIMFLAPLWINLLFLWTTKKGSEWLKQIINAHTHTMTHTLACKTNNTTTTISKCSSLQISYIRNKITNLHLKKSSKTFCIDSCLNNKWKPNKKKHESAHKTYTTTMTTPFKIEAT